MIRKSALLLLLAISAITVITSNAGAWGWGCHGHNPIFPRLSCRLHHGYPCVTCWRPYNAWSTRPGCGPMGCGHMGAGNAFTPGGCGPMGCGHRGGHCMAAPVMAGNMQMAQYFDPSLFPYMNQEMVVDASSGQPVASDIQAAAYYQGYGMQPYATPYASPYVTPAAYYPTPYASPYAMPYGYSPYQAYPSYWYGN